MKKKFWFPFLNPAKDGNRSIALRTHLWLGVWFSSPCLPVSNSEDVVWTTISCSTPGTVFSSLSSRDFRFRLAPRAGSDGVEVCAVRRCSLSRLWLGKPSWHSSHTRMGALFSWMIRIPIEEFRKKTSQDTNDVLTEQGTQCFGSAFIWYGSSNLGWIPSGSRVWWPKFIKFTTEKN